MPIRFQHENSNKKPLSELSFVVVDDGVTRSVPAIDKSWAQRDVFTNYVCLINSSGRIKTGAELEEWLYEAECFREDMEFLLHCRHYEFWSYMVYQKNVLAAIVSFLQRATPFYIDLCSQKPDEHVIELYESVLSLVLRVICRVLTNKESPEAWITNDHMRELIYKNFLISVPMLFDLLIAVGNADAQNATVLRRIFQTLLQIEPNYKQDLLAALAFFRVAFRSIQTQAENEGFEGAGGGMADDNEETPYDDVALYTLDCAYSISVLLDVCPAVRDMCGEIELGQCIAHFYDSTIPFLYKNIFLVNEAATSLSWLNQARLQFLKAFRSISYAYIESVLTKPEESLMPSENFIALLTETLSEQAFVVDYQREYPVESDVEILKQACKNLDDFKADFVVKGYKKEAESLATGTIGHIALTVAAQQPQYTNSNSVLENFAGSSVSQVNGETAVVAAAAAVSPTVRDIDLEVTAVLDVLPHLGTGFARRVLSRYDNSEEAIAAILEENLPPDLVNADQSEVYIPADPQDKLYHETGVKHYNVYDGDSYDVMTHDNPKCIIKQGKGFPDAPKTASQLLDDKRDLEKIRHRYQEYTLVSEFSDNDEQNEYEDEYDDSYEALLESETRVVKSKELKAGLANIDDVSDDDDEEDVSDEGNNEKSDAYKSETKRDNRRDFCENPEIVRARYEARRQAKWNNKKGTGGGDSTSLASNKTHDVVGAPKGQGQDKETLRNRNKKETNKASRANHNRKAGASFKRNKGMIS